MCMLNYLDRTAKDKYFVMRIRNALDRLIIINPASNPRPKYDRLAEQYLQRFFRVNSQEIWWNRIILDYGIVRLIMIRRARGPDWVCSMFLRMNLDYRKHCLDHPFSRRGIERTTIFSKIQNFSASSAWYYKFRGQQLFIKTKKAFILMI